MSCLQNYKSAIAMYKKRIRTIENWTRRTGYGIIKADKEKGAARQNPRKYYEKVGSHICYFARDRDCGSRE